uniref:Uncharacterized protein n=1 Tax=Glossina palpalis gambiensis TaxID=67801 RepID=A0A1B0BT71_9MUSC
MSHAERDKSEDPIMLALYPIPLVALPNLFSEPLLIEWAYPKRRPLLKLRLKLGEWLRCNCDSGTDCERCVTSLSEMKPSLPSPPIAAVLTDGLGGAEADVTLKDAEANPTADGVNKDEATTVFDSSIAFGFLATAFMSEVCMILLPFSINTGEINDVGFAVVVAAAAIVIDVDVDCVVVSGDDESVTVGLLMLFRIASEEEFLSNFSSASPI